MEVNVEKKRKYYENVDIIRGFAILLVVLGHALATDNIITTDSKWCNVVHDFIYSFHMPLFFLISGFCYVQPEKYGKFFLRKCRYLLIPYMVFNIITMVMQRLLPFFTLVENNLGEEIRRVFLQGGFIWFVYVLFEIMVIFPLIAKIIDGKVGRTVILLMVSVAIYIFAGKNIGFLCISQLTYYLPYFIIGHFLRIAKEEGRFSLKILDKKQVRMLLAVAILLADIGMIYAWNQFIDNGYIGYMFKVFIALAGSAASYLLISMVEGLKVRQILKQLGQYSLQIYLFNGYFIAVARTILFSVLHISNTAVLAIANFLVGLVCNYIWCYYILKINFVKVFCGKR